MASRTKDYLMSKRSPSIEINRGVELLLRRRKVKQPNIFFIRFGKIVTFLKREITINFEFSLDITKK